MHKKVILPVVLLLMFASQVFSQGDAKELIEMIKKNLSDSKASIKKYEWVETTTVFYKGEQKSVKQFQCYYGVDGKMTKVETGGGTDAKKPGGIRGRIAENKKDDITDYVEKAVAQVKTYLPPDGAKLEQIYTSGKSTVQILEPGKKFKLGFPDYNLPGDLLSITIDKSAQQLIALDVNTYTDKADQQVIFNVTYSVLPDNTQYQGSTTLEAKAKNVKIVIANSGFKKGSGQ